MIGTLEEIFGKCSIEERMHLQRIDDVVDRGKYLSEISKISSFKWKWYFDKEEKNRMVMFVNSSKGKIFEIACREMCNEMLWTSHTGITQKFGKAKQFRIAFEKAWNGLIISQIMSNDAKVEWREIDESTYEKIIDSYLFEITLLDHPYDEAIHPQYYGMWQLEFMGSKIMFETKEDAMHSICLYLGRLAYSVG